VPDCFASPFEILLQDPESDEFIRGWRLDDATKDLAVEAASSAGECSTICSGSQQAGIYVTFSAEVVEPGTALIPPLVRAVSDVIVTTPDSLSCPGGSEYPPEPEADGGGAGDAGEDGVLQLDDGLTLESADNGDATASFTVTYQGDAWVALAVSPDGQMVGSQAVIGLPDEGTVQIYDLNARETEGVVPAEVQILTESSITQEGGVTTLEFQVPLDTDGFRVTADGENQFLYAYGSSNVLGFHAKRNPFLAELGAGAAAEDSPICIEGYLMDSFCIARGNLVDNPSVKTLCEYLTAYDEWFICWCYCYFV